LEAIAPPRRRIAADARLLSAHSDRSGDGAADERSRGKGIAGSRPSGRSLSGNAIARVARFGAGALLSLGELSSATSGSLTVALRAAASELRGTGLLVRREREQAPTASSGTAACPGVATLLLNARSRRSGCLLASTSGAPGGCSRVALAMRPMLVPGRPSALRRSAPLRTVRAGFPAHGSSKP
jgi:hypothetical protein